MHIAILTARGGSTRIPGKNKKLFNGKPVIYYPLRILSELKHMGRLDRIVVSTDDEEIRDIGWAHGAEHLEREPEFAENAIGTKAVMAREVERLQLAPDDNVACVYPTAVMMSASDFMWGASMLWMRPAYFVVSIGIEPLADAGQFYWSLAAHWQSTLPIFGIRTAYFPVETKRVCDINTMEDFARAERMYQELQERA